MKQQKRNIFKFPRLLYKQIKHCNCLWILYLKYHSSRKVSPCFVHSNTITKTKFHLANVNGMTRKSSYETHTHTHKEQPHFTFLGYECIKFACTKRYLTLNQINLYKILWLSELACFKLYVQSRIILKKREVKKKKKII